MRIWPNCVAEGFICTAEENDQGWPRGRGFRSPVLSHLRHMEPQSSHFFAPLRRSWSRGNGCKFHLAAPLCIARPAKFGELSVERLDKVVDACLNRRR